MLLAEATDGTHSLAKLSEGIRFFVCRWMDGGNKKEEEALHMSQRTIIIEDVLTRPSGL